MATIAVTHAMEDIQVAEQLYREFQKRGHGLLTIGEGQIVGRYWQDDMENIIPDLDAMIVIVSSALKNNENIMSQMAFLWGYISRRGEPRVIPVVIEDISVPDPLSAITAIYCESRDITLIADRVEESLDQYFGEKKARDEARREVHEKVEQSAAEYIGQAIKTLQKQEDKYRNLAYWLYGLAYLTMLISVGMGLWRTLALSPSQASWPSLLELAMAGLIVIALLVALSKYAFTLGKSFMVESLRNADRRHAISFGEFYLKAFGEQFEWQEVKDAFQHWNIDKGSKFISQDSNEIDPQIMTLATEIARAIAGRERKGF